MFNWVKNLFKKKQETVWTGYEVSWTTVINPQPVVETKKPTKQPKPKKQTKTKKKGK